jgi:glycosyltransferase involved in cell wall biosynthesis
MAPSVSIIIPTFNRADLIPRSIKSVLNQTYMDFELIIVDDASTDNTEDIIQNIDDSRLRYIKHEENRGGSAARNTGIRAAQADFIAFQDSDDEWLPEKLDKQMRIFEDAPLTVGVVYAGFWRIEGGQKQYIPGPSQQVRDGDIHDQLLKGNFITTQAAVVRKECFKKAGLFDEHLARLQDWELFIRISRHYNFLFIDEPLVISYFTPESISSKEDNLIKACELILDKHHDDLIKYRKFLSGHQYFIADRSLKSGNRQKGISFLWEAFKNNPRPGFLLSIIAAMMGQRIYTQYSALSHTFISENEASAPTGGRS